MLKTEDQAHFIQSLSSDHKFWKRLGGKPNVKGKVILDIGCGWGGLSLELAQSGAQRVIGIDLTKSRINFCKEHLKQNFPHLQNCLEYHCCELADLKLNEAVDIIVSKDTFEHVENLEQLLIDIASVLRPNGIVMSGFGPLYNSYFGDHKATDAKLPWFHLLLPESYLIRRLNKKRGLSLSNIKDLGLNKLSFKDYLSIFENAPLNTEYFVTNGSERIASKIFRILARVPFLREYFTQSIYIIMRKC